MQQHEMTAQELIKRTQEVEDERVQKQNERVKKKLDKEKKRKQQQVEKLVGPILLVITITISIVVKYLLAD